LFQVAQFPMHRDNKLRTGEVQQEFHFLLAGMTRNMHRGNCLVDHIRTQCKETVDGAVNILLVAGDGMRRQDDGIAGDHVKEPVAGRGKPPED